jgi:uncharacterized protein (DUF1499 family)
MRPRTRVTSKGWSRRPAPISPVAVAGFVFAIVALVGLALAGFGSRWGWWHFGQGFTFLRWSAYLGGVAAVVSLAGLVHARPNTGRRGLVLALIGLVAGSIAIGVPWQWQRMARGAPPIHDITTDVENPPEFVAIQPLRADAPNPVEYGGQEVAAQQAAAYPDIRPLRVDAAPEVAFSRALQASRSLGWEIVHADTMNLRIEATDETFWFGFRDDVVIRVTPAAGGGSRVDVRSKSRIGRGDVGTNARRIRRFAARMEGR